MNEKPVTVTVELPNEVVAVALAQFLKRVGWSEIRINAVDDDDACAMRDALEKVRLALFEIGFAPR